MMLPIDTPLQLLGVYEGDYRVRYKDILGFIHYIFIDQDYKQFAADTYTPVGSRIEYDYENEPSDIPYFANIEYTKAIYKQPRLYRDTLSVMPDGEIFPVTHYNAQFWKATYNGQMGYGPKSDTLRLGNTRKSVETAGESGPQTTEEFLRDVNNTVKSARRPAKVSVTAVDKTMATKLYYITWPKRWLLLLDG